MIHVGPVPGLECAEACCLRVVPDAKYRTFQGRCYKAQGYLRGMIQDNAPQSEAVSASNFFRVAGKQPVSQCEDGRGSISMQQPFSPQLPHSSCYWLHGMQVEEINIYPVKPASFGMCLLHQLPDNLPSSSSYLLHVLVPYELEYSRVVNVTAEAFFCTLLWFSSFIPV